MAVYTKRLEDDMQEDRSKKN